MFSLICAWIYGWVNNREAGDLRRHRSHYDVTIMCSVCSNVYHQPAVRLEWRQLPQSPLPKPEHISTQRRNRRYNRWYVGTDMQFHPSLYLSMLGLNLIRVDERGPKSSLTACKMSMFSTTTWLTHPIDSSIWLKIFNLCFNELCCLMDGDKICNDYHILQIWINNIPFRYLPLNSTDAAGHPDFLLSCKRYLWNTQVFLSWNSQGSMTIASCNSFIR